MFRSVILSVQVKRLLRRGSTPRKCFNASKSNSLGYTKEDIRQPQRDATLTRHTGTHPHFVYVSKCDFLRVLQATTLRSDAKPGAHTHLRPEELAVCLRTNAHLRGVNHKALQTVEASALRVALLCNKTRHQRGIVGLHITLRWMVHTLFCMS